MSKKRSPATIEGLESRTLFSWSSYAQLVGQDKAGTDFPTINGSGVTVAVIDTGINYNLPSLGGGIGSNFKVIGGYDFLDNDSDPMDEDGHGTDTASVIAANPYTTGGITYQGVAPGAKLVALRVGTEQSITNDNIERALRWVINNYSTYKIKVVNLSLGSGNYTDAQTSSQLSDEFKQLRDLGIFVVAASGNSNDEQAGPISEDGVAYPAADPNVFAVGAVDSSDVISNWTQRSSELDLLAPGVNIVMPGLTSGFVTEDGTSFASPYVAGTAALIKQADPTAKAGDIGSILMSSGVANRDGDAESGNTTGLLFSRLDIDAALKLAATRVGKTASLVLGSIFDTALDSQGVLHAAFYDYIHGDLLYATRDTSGLWSSARVIDSAGVVGSQLSVAVDASGKAAIAYYDASNADLKYASFSGLSWSTETVDSNKTIGNAPSLAFDIDGNAYVSYYRRTGGYLRLARLFRDDHAWLRQTIDGGTGAIVGALSDIDVGEAAVRVGGFTEYDTTVAIAYADSTNGDLKYARLDVDNSSATWVINVVANTNGVSNIDLDLHLGPLNLGLQAQIAYLDVQSKSVKYAYKNTDWFVENIVTGAQYGASVQLSFDDAERPEVTYYNSSKKAIYTSTRQSSTSWSTVWNTTSYWLLSVATNERTGEKMLSWMTRDKLSMLSSTLS